MRTAGRAGRWVRVWMGAACGMAALVASAGCGRPQAGGTELAPVVPLSLVAGGMHVVWHTPLTLDPPTRVTEAWVRGGYLVCRAGNNRIYVLNAASGVLLWSRRMAEPYQDVYAPAVYQDTLYVASTTKLTALRVSDGRVLDETGLDFAPAGGIVTNGEHCYIPAWGGWLQAVALVPKTMSWGRWTEGAMTAAPALDSTSVFFGSQSGEILASAQNTRRVSWVYQTEGPIVADLKRTKSGLILAASLDYSLYAINGSSGRREWRFDAGEPLKTPPYADGGQVFVFADGIGLVVLDEATGRIQWRETDAQAYVGVDADTLYSRSRDDLLVAAARTDGAKRFAVPLRADTLVAVNETGTGVLYLVTEEGLVQALARKGAPEEAAPSPPAAPIQPAVPTEPPPPSDTPAPEETPAPADATEPADAGGGA